MLPSIKKILIANRGEIAVRVIRACKELGIKSAAIYSDSDKTSLHTRLADESYFIGESNSSQSYLNKEKIINLAKKIHADAIHPGYGFFSENYSFIETCENERINFIGPSSISVKMMGSKTAARELMKNHNVPIVPGTTSAIFDISEGKKIAEEIGYPVLLKASAGGGGKGMRTIFSSKEFDDAFQATKREAMKAFANDEIYIEKFIENPKHIEVQIIADKHGNYAHLFERECSVQRRHQKIIEESPSSFIDEDTRDKITKAAIDAAKACQYHNAGTVEFLMDKNKNFYFLEMNTRLQVEHPVTEMISGIDLVKEQISIAAGNKLSFSQKDLRINGCAIECRIYAEDSLNNFLPSTGKIFSYKIPSGPGVRVDDGFGVGSFISIYYDPLISKLICWAKDRQSAIKRMKRALSEYEIAGVVNNISFLNSLLDSKLFLDGSYNINFIENEFENILSNIKNFEAEIPQENVAAIFSVMHKYSSPSKKNDKVFASKFSNNKWINLKYE